MANPGDLISEHAKQEINSENGSHGLRWHDDALNTLLHVSDNYKKAYANDLKTFYQRPQNSLRPCSKGTFFVQQKIMNASNEKNVMQNMPCVKEKWVQIYGEFSLLYDGRI